MNFIYQNEVVFTGSGTVNLSVSFFHLKGGGGECPRRSPVDPPLRCTLSERSVDKNFLMWHQLDSLFFL